jgi:protein-S-isoprenylcysteine O-methyltransferase Ste14
MPNALSLVAAALSAYSFYNQLNAFSQTYSPIALGNTLFFALFIFLFICRSPSKHAETDPKVWILCLGAAWLPGLVYDPGLPVAPAWRYTVLVLQVLSLGGMVVALSQLGKGFGILPAVRQVKTHGLYRWIRHPLYATEIAYLSTVLLLAPTLWNISLVTLFIGLQTYRALTEEKLLLTHEATYRQYASQVKYRFIPFIV